MSDPASHSAVSGPDGHADDLLLPVPEPTDRVVIADFGGKRFEARANRQFWPAGIAMTPRGALTALLDYKPELLQAGRVLSVEIRTDPFLEE